MAKINKILKEKITKDESKLSVGKNIIKSSKVEVHIKEVKPAEYKPIFFNANIKEEKRNLFFS